MAQTPSIFNNPLSGNIGNQTFKDYGGTQVVTARFRSTSAKGSGASYEQRLRRILLPNLVLVASQIKNWLPVLFERNIYYKRPYTHFLSHNLNRALPTQPKEVIELKHCFWGSVQVSCGSLPRLKVTQEERQFFTDIPMEENDNLYEMPMSLFTQRLIDLGRGFMDGDYLVFFEVNTERTSTTAGCWEYSSDVRVGSLHLDLHNSNVVNDCWNGLGCGLYAKPNSFGAVRLAFSDSLRRSATMVHVRKVSGRWLSSTAEIVLGSTDETRIAEALSPAYIERVCMSYGYKPSVIN